MLLNMELVNQLRQPHLTSILLNRPVRMSITGFVVLQITLTWAGLPGWACPVLDSLGCPCPGCGLTRAMVALISGELKEMIAYHALAPFFLLGLILIALVTILPATLKQPIIISVEQLEKRTGITGIFLLVLVGYWLIRLVFFHNSYINLVMN